MSYDEDDGTEELDNVGIDRKLSRLMISSC